MRSPAMISGRARGSSTRQRSWRSVIPIPRPASLLSDRDVGEARDDVPVDDLQRVDGEDDDRRLPAEPGDRQEQEDEGERGDRVEDARGAGEASGPASAGGERDRASAKAIAKPMRHGDQDEQELVEQRGRVAVEVVGRPAEAEDLALLGLAGSVAAGPVVDRHLRRAAARAAASVSVAHRAARRGRSTAACSSTFASGEPRNSEMISIGEHAGDPPVGVDHRRVLASRPAAGRRARRASRRRGRGSARAACRGCAGTVSACRSRLGEPAERAALGVDDAGRAGPRRPRASPAPRPVAWPTKASGASQRSMSRTRISARPLQRPVGADEVLDEVVGRAPSGARPECAYWARRPPSCRIAIRSPILIASSMSWVTKRTVLRISA